MVLLADKNPQRAIVGREVEDGSGAVARCLEMAPEFCPLAGLEVSPFDNAILLNSQLAGLDHLHLAEAH